MAKWDKSSIYHSYLVREGRTMLKFTGDPIDSKYRKGEKVVGVQVPDDDTRYWLKIEPEVLPQIEAAPKDVWLMVSATGGKDEKPGLIIADDRGPIPSADDYEPPEDAPPIPMWPDDEPAPTTAPTVPTNGPTKGRTKAVAIAVAETIEAVRLLREAGVVVDATPIYSTHFIQASRG